MVIFSVNSKRIRRPNVRLWEIGDLPAAFARASYHRSGASLGQKRWKRKFSDVGESEYLQFSTEKQPEHTILDPSVSPRIINDIQHNRENKDPNSLKVASEFVNSDERNMTNCNLDFGTITRRSRLMKRRKRNPNSTCSLFGNPWNSKTGRQKTVQDEKGYGWNQNVACTSAADLDIFPVNGFKDSSQNETSARSKEAWENEIDDLNSRGPLQKPRGFSIEGACYEENATFLQFARGHNDKESSGCDVNGVSLWLEELGLGKFAELFEMHEVDEETLPFLTFEDLKDMGIVSVGPRRKLFNAIQQLKGGRHVGVCIKLMSFKIKGSYGVIQPKGVLNVN
ncbi:uncharacterized protein [Coffea arabica]|uniref:Uncharacterized protein isoform X2 n=1 Tax=Coffea arabica TaxID=13443 RepID=A0A6P6X1Z0_COFAR|nr:uncharacterized protein LOC113738678 isoform X2 [Coffea arabica]